MVNAVPIKFSFTERDALVAAARQFNLFNNKLLNVVLDDREVAQHVLRILTKIPDLVIVDVVTQKDIQSVIERDVILDILAFDSKGRVYNIEIQRSDTIDHRRRSRLYLSEIDHYLLSKGTRVDALPDKFHIYISETDIHESGLAWDTVESRFGRSRKKFDDGSTIIYDDSPKCFRSTFMLDS